MKGRWERRRNFSSYVVSQISYDAESIAAWVRIARRQGLTLPIHIGLPGAVDRLKLLRVSMKIGVGDSELAPHLSRPDNDIHGLHIYTFNEMKRTEAWRKTMIGRLEAVRSVVAGG